MRVIDVITARGLGGFFYDDQEAIRLGAETDGFVYRGHPVAPGFKAIRVPAETLSIGLVLEDEAVVWGDMVGVQYSGTAGRDPLFQVEHAERITREVIAPRLIGGAVSEFRSVAVTALAPTSEGERLPVAVEYGVSQALLRASAHVHRVTLAEQICVEFGWQPRIQRVPIYAQSGDGRDINVDKMILKGVDILPHGLINSRAKFGRNGEVFRDFVRWVRRRVGELGAPGYNPTLHFDVYGWIGYEFGLNVEIIADFIGRVAGDADPLQLNIECPADFGSRDAQIEGYAGIVEQLKKLGCGARVVVDERCNTLEDIRAFAVAHAGDLIQIKMPDVGNIVDSIVAVAVCQANGVGAYLGGSCVETDLSSIASVHVAVASQPQMMLAKPGMGVDEALSLVTNEQNRLLVLLERRRAARR